MATSLKDILPHVLRATSGQAWKIDLFMLWPSIVGKLKTTITIEKVQETTLIVGVAHSGWLHELYMLTDMLKERINTALGTPHIAHIKFIIRPERDARKMVSIKKYPTVTPLQPYTLKPHEQAAIATINDQELSHSLERFLVRCRSNK